jgi:hypothetical protein
MSDRINNDQYYTPAEVVDAILRHPSVQETLDLNEDSVVLEPSAGNCIWIQRLIAGLSVTPVIYCNDIEWPAKSLLWQEYECLVVRSTGDFLQSQFPDCDLIVGNPPYKGAVSHVRRALALTKKKAGNVVMLLPLAFLASNSRAEFWTDHPPSDVIILSDRPPFRSDRRSGGSRDYAAFVWKHGSKGDSRVSWLTNNWNKNSVTKGGD